MALTAKTERDNFSRLGQGIVGTGNAMARDLLSSYLSPADLVAKVIPGGRPNHFVWSRLRKDQQDLVRNAGSDGYTKFDISLIYTLLRNVCTNLGDPSKPNLPAPTQGWDKDPQQCDVTPSDDMERLRKLRNTVYGHVSEPFIKESEYKIHWQELKCVASRMQTCLGGDYLKNLQEAEIYKMSDADVKEIIKEIQSWKEYVPEIKEHTKETAQEQTHEIKEHTKETAQEQTLEIKEHTKQIAQKCSREIKKYIKKQGRKISRHIKKEQDQRLREQGQQMKEKLEREQDGDTMPVELLFASVVITEDIKSHDRRNLKREQKTMSKHASSQSTREVSTPADIFMIDSKYARKIFLKGDAAHGKTTYCLWLLRKWCDAKIKIENLEKLDEWEKAMQEFEYVFLIQLRYVNPNRSNVIDMICNDLFQIDTGCHDIIRRVLSSDVHKSLIIMDGLDEWNPNEEVRKTCPEMPNLEGLSSGVTCFISMRSWLFPAVSKYKGDRVRVLEIHGLSESAMEKVIENVLCNHYKLKKDTLEYKKKHDKIQRNLNEKNLKSFMQIPLLAVVCVQIWCEEENVEDSMTGFYTNMLNMMIERAYLKHESTKHMSLQTADSNFPKLLTAKKCIRDCTSVLLRLGKVAFEGLLPAQMKLVFQEDELRSEIGSNELQFALNVGLISQNEARSLTTRKVTVNFFHLSMQEFLAAIFYVSQNDVTGGTLCSILSSINVVMKWSNVIVFICGLSPSLGSIISKHVNNLAKSDREICKERESNAYLFLSVRKCHLYRGQVHWLKEIKATQPKKDSKVVSYISDVVLNEFSDKETVRVTLEFLEKGYFDKIRSLSFNKVSTLKENYNFETPLKSCLLNTNSLVTLRLDPYNPAVSVHTMRLQTLKVLKLGNFKICNTYFRKNTPLLSNMPNLHTLELSFITFVDVEKMCTPMLSDMPNLKRLEIRQVNFSGMKLENTPLLSNMPKLHVLHISCYSELMLENKPLWLNLHSLVLQLMLGDISCNGLKPDDVPLLSNMPMLHSLKIINISDDELNSVHTNFLSNMPYLHRLELTSIRFTELNLEDTPLLSNMPNLQILKLEYIICQELKLGDTPLLSNMLNLQILKLDFMIYKELELGDTPLLSNMPNLQILKLKFIKCKEMKLENITLMSNMPNIRSIRLQYINIPVTLELSSDMVHLKVVTLHEVDLSEVGWKRFISSLTQIQHGFKINLIYEKMAEKMVHLTCHAPHFTKLTFHRTYDGEYESEYVCTYLGRYIYLGRHIGLYGHELPWKRRPRRFLNRFHGKTCETYGRNVNRFVGKYVKYRYVKQYFHTKISFERVWPVPLNIS